LSESKRAILEDIFRSAGHLESEDDTAENIVIPFLLRLGYDRADIRRKVSIVGRSGKGFTKQADIVVDVEGRAGLVVETKRLRHALREEDANQVLSYATLLEPPAPFAVLTNGREWEQYTLDSDEIGGLEDIVEPAELRAEVLQAPQKVDDGRRTAAERLLVTLENRPALEAAFADCRRLLAREGLIAESAFDELTKILVCKFNEEKRASDGVGPDRFTCAWLEGAGPITGLNELFGDARKTFHVFPPGAQLNLRDNKTAIGIVRALEPFAFYGFKTPVGLAGAGGDVVGSVYEAFLSGTLRGDLGQYLTPRTIIEFMVEIADLQPGQRVLDLSCGSGGFLIRAFMRIRKIIRSLPNSPDEKQQMEADLVTNHLWGIDINSRLATLCRINLILHGDGYEHIYTGDSVREDVFENTEGRLMRLSSIEDGTQPKFDVILMNPPFNLPYEDQSVLARYKLGRGRTTQGSDYLMLERALSLLRDDGGRLLIVMPHGVASGTSERDIRDFIKTTSAVSGCISLPVGTFKCFGGSNARTAILCLRKGGPDSKGRFLAQAEHLGYDISSKYYREVENNDLPEIAEAFRALSEAQR
jgi:type I restriction enzyme M protein